jgi:hypothetical protein
LFRKMFQWKKVKKFYITNKKGPLLFFIFWSMLRIIWSLELLIKL